MKNDIYVTLELTRREYIWLRAVTGHARGNANEGYDIFDALHEADPSLSNKVYEATEPDFNAAVAHSGIEASLKKAGLL
jgi:hypothetical protein